MALGHRHKFCGNELIGQCWSRDCWREVAFELVKSAILVRARRLESLEGWKSRGDLGLGAEGKTCTAKEGALRPHIDSLSHNDRLKLLGNLSSRSPELGDDRAARRGHYGAVFVRLATPESSTL